MELARTTPSGIRRTGALAAIAALDAPPCADVRDLADDTAGSERSLLVEALGRCPNPETIRWLGAWARESEDPDQLVAISALARIGRPVSMPVEN